MPRWAKILAWVLGSFFALVFLVAIFAPTPPPQPAQPQARSSAQAPAATPSPAPQPTEDETVIKTTDLKLAQAYADNEVAAQNKYGDKTLWVKGYVTGITLDIMSHPVVQMRGTNQFLPTQASFDDSAKGDLSKLRKGDIVTMQCTEITEVVSTPMLSGCTLMANSVR